MTPGCRHFAERRFHFCRFTPRHRHYAAADIFDDFAFHFRCFELRCAMVALKL